MTASSSSLSLPEPLSCVCSIAGGPDLACEVTDIKAAELSITVAVVARIGDRITAVDGRRPRAGPAGVARPGAVASL